VHHEDAVTVCPSPDLAKQLANHSADVLGLRVEDRHRAVVTVLTVRLAMLIPSNAAMVRRLAGLVLSEPARTAPTCNPAETSANMASDQPSRYRHEHAACRLSPCSEQGGASRG
jgi:hypothetical protein